MPPAPTMSPALKHLIERQKELSGYMRLLAALLYENPSSMISNASMRPDDEFKEDLRHLETIAACLVTGKKGDVIASAFLREGQSLRIVLARNDAASEEDEGHSMEFLELLQNADKQQLGAFVPFLVRRGRDSVQRRIDKVRDLTRKSNEEIKFVVEGYCRSKSNWILQSEFPGRGQHLLNLRKVKGINISSAGLQKILKDIIKILMAGLELDEQRDASVSFVLFANAAAALSDSAFFKFAVLKIDADSLDLPKFRRNLDKMRSYLRIPELIDFIQKFSSVCIEWVPEEIASPDHVRTRIIIPSVLDVALDLARQNKQSPTIDLLEAKFLERNPYWKESYAGVTSIGPKLHAEIQIVLYLTSLDKTEGRLRPVGCSKRSCLQCEIVMDQLDGGRWKTAGAHAWPYETAALTGDNKCDERLCRIIKSYANNEVKRLLGVKPARPTHAKKNSEEYVTASSGSENELEPVIGKFQALK